MRIIFAKNNLLLRIMRKKIYLQQIEDLTMSNTLFLLKKIF